MQRIIAENRSLNEYSLMHKKSDGDGFPKNVPSSWRHKGHFWYVSELLGFMLLRPNRGFEDILLQAKRDAGWFDVGEVGVSERLVSIA